jgi:GT2 family glycosyltransferase/glycosyltransferase involved in cell wall biosynthesis
LVELGVQTAAPDRLIGADPASNPYGHYEVRALTDFNDQLLAAAGGHWAAPPTVSQQVVDELTRSHLGDAARGELATDLPGDGWFWKDPRLCVLLPFWAALVEPFVAVFVHRHPAEVAASLERRNGLVPAYGLALWERYIRSAMDAVTGVPTHVLSYDQLISDPVAALTGLVAFLGQHGWSDLADPHSVVTTIDPEQRHHSGVEQLLSESQQELTARLAAHAGCSIPRPDAEDGSAESTALAFDVVAGLGSRLDDLHLLAELRQTLADERKAAEGDLERQRVEFEEQRAAMDRLMAADRGRARANAERLEAELTRQQERARAHIDHLEEVRRRYERLMAEMGSQLDDARRQTAALDGALADANRRLDEQGSQLREIVESRAFRAVSAARAGVNRTMPPGTRRRAAYSGAVDRASRVVGGLRRSAAGRPLEPPSVTLPDPPDPRAAIVIPAYGHREVTHRCLEALRDAPVETPFRTIVVDDCSPDDTAAYLMRCGGIHVVTNPTNVGFLHATNRGVAASGDTPFVVLLNNDTAVTAGWLDSLLAPFDDPAVGAVGAKLVYPDGALQEVGSIVWRDGTGWNYGRGDDPNRYHYQHVREVDYCSAACLAVRREIWATLGGFDEQYAPAYYEDTDLCFGVRALGARVVVQPAAVVVHHEGRSHGTDGGAGGKANQERNRPIFASKWRDQLAAHPENEPGLVRRRADRRAGPAVLVVDHQVPTPDRDSGSLRMSKLLEMLVALGYRVSFLPFNGSRYPPYGDALHQLGIEVVAEGVEPHVYLDEVGSDLGVVILSRPVVGMNLLPLVRERAPGAAVIYDMVDLHSLRKERRSSVAGSHVDGSAPLLADMEALLVGRTDMTFAISDVERDLMLRAVPDADIVTIPNVHDAPLSTTPFGDRSGLLFVGSWNHPPNQDAITYLVDEVMGRLRDRLPGVGLLIAGSDIPPRLADRGPDIEVLGWVPDLDGLFDRVRLSVAPLRYGAGLKGKVGDSLVRGVPVVTTSIGAEGFDDRITSGLVVADALDDYVDAVVELYEDEPRWTAMAAAARSGTLAALGYEAVQDRLAGAVGRLMGEREATGA